MAKKRKKQVTFRIGIIPANRKRSGKVTKKTFSKSQILTKISKSKAKVSTRGTAKRNKQKLILFT